MMRKSLSGDCASYQIGRRWNVVFSQTPIARAGAVVAAAHWRVAANVSHSWLKISQQQNRQAYAKSLTRSGGIMSVGP